MISNRGSTRPLEVQLQLLYIVSLKTKLSIQEASSLLGWKWQVIQAKYNHHFIKGVLHPWTLFLKTLCIFSNK